MKNSWKTLLITAGVLLSILSCSRDSGNIVIGIDDIGKHDRVLILVHPTENNIKTFNYLIDSKIFPIPSVTKVIGVYHTSEKYDYSKSVEYIKKNKLENFRLLPVKEPITETAIYRVNECTDVFVRLTKVSNGFIFTGGPDIPPSIYGEKTSLLTQITDPARHYFEVSFMFHLIGGSKDTLFQPLLDAKPLMPVVGICLGMQTMNVAAGGTLVQDIPSEIYGIESVEDALIQQTNNLHRNYNANYALDDKLLWGNFHQVSIVDEPLKSICQGQPWVLSSHHQGVERLGRNLKIIATSIDGNVVEAIVHTKYPNVIGVQFHPEPTLLYNNDEFLRFLPNQPSRLTYLNMYSGEAGEKFHLNFWSWFGKKVIEQ
ncbi:gamma-glutamyl-gamma-aminobutyrate hydrolase family protein [Tenuifilum osseticum]|uniref:gamma-glutamyl-gamma-aminobutyrate hydrolase family protein n=1 Tax=Tenuifilum osseticum TaxID=3374723 RepID=UPI0034E3DE78